MRRRVKRFTELVKEREKNPNTPQRPEMADTALGKRLAYMLISGSTQKEICEELKILPATINRQLKKKKFQKLLNDVEHDMYRRVERRFGSLYGKAIDKLDMMLDACKYNKDGDEVGPDHVIILEAIDKVFRIHKKYDDNRQNPSIVFNNPSLALPEGQAQKLMHILSLPPSKEVDITPTKH